ncbi:MAG: hypothetical protein WD874_01045 [Parcubacteria group bacterium]
MKRIFVSLTALSLMLGAGSASALVDARANSEAKAAVEVRQNVFRDLQMKFRESIEGRKESIKEESEARKEAMKDARGDFNVEVRTMSAERKAEKAEKADERIQAKVTGLIRAYMNVISQLENIISRINSRIDKVEARGGDTTIAKAKVDAALRGIVEAKLRVNALANLDLTVASGTASTTVRAKNEAARTASALVKESLKSVRQNLMQAVRSLNMSVRGEVNAATTATSTDQ